MIKFSRISEIERRTFLYTCGLAFFLPLSKAVGNIFLVLALLGLAHRLILKRDDAAEIFRANEKIFLSLGALLVSIFFSAIFSDDVAYGVKRFSDRYLYHMSAMLPVIFLHFKRRQIIILAKILLAGVFLSNAAVIFQAVPNLSEKHWRYGGFLGVMAQASLLTMFLPVYAILFMHFRQRLLKIFFALVILTALTALILNGTRGAWLAVLILIPAVVLLYSKNRSRPISAMLAGLVLIGGIFAASPILSSRFATIFDMKMQSNSERLLMWQSAFKMFEDHPILGIGYGQYIPAYQTQYISPEAKEPAQKHAHNNFIQILAECGIFSAAAFLWIWIYFSYFSLRGWYRERDLAHLLFFCVLWGLMLHGLTEYNFETSVPSKVFWFSLGLFMAYRRRE